MCVGVDVFVYVSAFVCVRAHPHLPGDFKVALCGVHVYLCVCMCVHVRVYLCVCVCVHPLLLGEIKVVVVCMCLHTRARSVARSSYSLSHLSSVSDLSLISPISHKRCNSRRDT